jgi:uncharacterized protein (TIGR00369 family)
MRTPVFATRPEDLPAAARIAAMSGLDIMRAMLAGDLPHPPIARVMGYRLEAVEPGRVVFRGVPQFDHLNPMGTTHGGWYGTLIDSAMGCAVMTRLPAGRTYTTLEYRVNIVRAIPVGTEILATGQTDHAGRSTAVAQGRIAGVSDGQLYATGSTTCLIMEARG